MTVIGKGGLLTRSLYVRLTEGYTIHMKNMVVEYDTSCPVLQDPWRMDLTTVGTLITNI